MMRLSTVLILFFLLRFVWWATDFNAAERFLERMTVLRAYAAGQR